MELSKKDGQVSAESGVTRCGCGRWYAFGEFIFDDNPPERWQGPHRDTEELAEKDAYRYVTLFQQFMAERGYGDFDIRPAFTVN